MDIPHEKNILSRLLAKSLLGFKSVCKRVVVCYKSSFLEHERKEEGIYIPHDIVESILSRLPAKSLLRFKGVCKQWSAAVSDPKFAETHYKVSNTSSNIHFIGTGTSMSRCNTFIRVGVKNGEFQELSTVGNPLVGYCAVLVLGYYNGLFVLRCCAERKYGEFLFLWNPSTSTCRDVRCPHPFRRDIVGLKSGICYDPLLKDYKLVIADDDKNYAVYYCKTKSWSELKKMSFHVKFTKNSGVHYKGSIYWLIRASRILGHVIICFDGRDEEFKTLGYCVDAHGSDLISTRDCLYFIPTCRVKDPRCLVMMKKVGDGDDLWVELKQELPFDCFFVKPLCLTQDNQILFRVLDMKQKDHHLLYDDTKRCFTPTTGLKDYHHISPDLQNLLLL